MQSSLATSLPESPADTLFQEALALHQSGEIEAADTHYKAILTAYPEHVDTLTNLGILRLQQGDVEEAIRFLTVSLMLDDEQANAHYIHGCALRALNRFDEALVSYEKAIVLVHDVAEYFAKRGEALFYLKRFEEALVSYDAAIALSPKTAAYYCDRGVVFLYVKRFEEALAYFDCALVLEPESADAHNNRGNALRSLKRFEEALTSYNQVIATNPEDAEAHSNRGNALRDLARFEEALASYDRAIALRPGNVEAMSNRGVMLATLRRFDEAHASYKEAIQLQPEYSGALWNQSLLYLLQGDYEKGWSLYESRWKSSAFAGVLRDFPQPLWLGQVPVKGKTVFVHLEQGVGDFIQFCRYIPMLEKLGAKVILETLPSMKTLISTLSPTITLVERGEAVTGFDLHCPLMSLPLAFNTTVETIPATIPYLGVDPEKQAAWKKKLGTSDTPRIGLVWSGMRSNKNDHNRSMTLETLKPVLRFPLDYHAVQRDIREEDIATWGRLPQLRPHTKDLTDFADTAALIDAMDLIITVDTAVAHLAGALGKPVWIMLPYEPDFRWMLEREDSPWYPTARLFRQTKPGDWDGVVGRVYRSLGKMTSIHD